MLLRTSWATRHGDSEKSAIWAVVDDNNQPVDLSGWVVRAQLRTGYDAETVDAAFTTDHGITVAEATLAVAGRVLTTSTVQLYLDPVDWASIPSPYAGLLDIEIASDTSTTPVEVHTLVEVAFTADSDVTRE